MSEADRIHWDARYEEGGLAPIGDHGPPPILAEAAHLLPEDGDALELACGRGRAAVWLAKRGLRVHGADVSPVAIDLARQLVQLSGVADRCRLEVHDLDQGLPPGEQVDLIFCHLFRDPDLDEAIVGRLKSGGVLAMASLSEVDAEPGRFHLRPGELENAFGSELEILSHVESEGMAALIARRN